MSTRPLAVLLLALPLACAEPRVEPTIENHGPTAGDVRGLLRESADGPFVAGAVETFRALYDATKVTSARWSATAGALEARGSRATWTLPEAGDATLTLTLSMRDGREVSAPFGFRVQPRLRSSGVASAAEALLATPMPVLDGGVAEITGGACDLQYDGAGNAHIAFTSSTHPGLYYGRWNGTAWTVELVDGMGFNTGGDVTPSLVSMAVESGGTPHIAYVVKSTIGYATKPGASWTRERVDTPATPYSGSTSYPVSIALNPAQANRPAISYPYIAVVNFTSYTRAAIAVRAGAANWTVATPVYTTHTTAYAQYLRGEITFDAAGTLYLPLYAYGSPSTNDAYYLATWTPTATAFKSMTLAGTAAPGFNSNRTSLAWAGAGRLISRSVEGVYDISLASPLSASTLTWSVNEAGGGSSVGDLTWAGGRPYVLHQHGSSLELVTPNASGFWTYTQLGSTAGASAAMAMHPSSGQPSICYQSGGRIMFQ